MDSAIAGIKRYLVTQVRGAVQWCGTCDGFILVVDRTNYRLDRFGNRQPCRSAVRGLDRTTHAQSGRTPLTCTPYPDSSGSGFSAQRTAPFARSLNSSIGDFAHLPHAARGKRVGACVERPPGNQGAYVHVQRIKRKLSTSGHRPTAAQSRTNQHRRHECDAI